MQDIGLKTPLDFITRDHAEAFMGMSRDTLIRLQNKGCLVPYRVGRQVFYKIGDINALIKQGCAI